WPAELIVRNGRTRADCSGPTRQILHPAAPAVVADHNVELAIRPELDNAAVVVAAQRLPCIGLERVQPDERAVHGERRTIPDEAVDAVAAQRNRTKICRIGTGRALGPVEIDARIGWKVGMQRDV